MRNTILLTFLAILISGCASQEPAPIEFNRARADTESGSSAHTEEEIILKPQANLHEYNSATGYLNEKRPEEPLVIPGSLQDNTKIIYHEVQTGETVEIVAKNYDSTVEDIIKLNDLTPPFKLDEFQIIKIKVSSDVLNKRNREAPIVQADSHAMYPEASMLNIIKPVDGKIITTFGKPTKTGKSNGVNIATTAGTPVKAVADGVVVKSGNSARYGNLIIVKLDGANIFVAYAHLKDLILKVDQKVAQGEIIGHVGSTGEVSAPQLHFAIKEGNTAVDPLKYIPDLGSNQETIK